MSIWASPGLLALFLLFIVLSLIAWNQPRALGRSAQYEEAVPGFAGSSDHFFALLYAQLQSDLTQSALPFGAVGFGPRQLFAKRHILSGRAVYLEVRYEDLAYFVYATPAPGGLHVSTWLFSKHELWLQHPLLKWLVAFHLTQMTLFQFDIMRLFHAVVQGALGTVLDELRREQGLLPLESYERRPVLSGFYASMCYGSSASGMTAPSMIAPVIAGRGAGGKGLIAPGVMGFRAGALSDLAPEQGGQGAESLESQRTERAQWDIAEPPLVAPQGSATLGAPLPVSRFTAAARAASLAPGASASEAETAGDAEPAPA